MSAPLPAPDATLQVVLQVVYYHSAYILTFAQGLATMPKVCALEQAPESRCDSLGILVAKLLRSTCSVITPSKQSLIEFYLVIGAAG